MQQWNGVISTWGRAEEKGDDEERKYVEYGDEWKVVGYKKRGNVWCEKTSRRAPSRRVPSNVLVKDGRWYIKGKFIGFYDGVGKWTDAEWALREFSEKTEAAILRKLISELRIAYPHKNFNHLDVTSLENFKRSYGRGITEWDCYMHYGFMNLFSADWTSYEFKGLSMREHDFLMYNFASVLLGARKPSPTRSDEDVEEYVQMACKMRKVSINAMTTDNLRMELDLHMEIKNKQRELRNAKSTVYSEYNSLEEMAYDMETFEYDIPYMIETLISRRARSGWEMEPLLSEVHALDLLREKCDNGYEPRANEDKVLDREDELYSKLASTLLLN